MRWVTANRWPSRRRSRRRALSLLLFGGAAWLGVWWFTQWQWFAAQGYASVWLRRTVAGTMLFVLGAAWCGGYCALFLRRLPGTVTHAGVPPPLYRGLERRIEWLQQRLDMAGRGAAALLTVALGWNLAVHWPEAMLCLFGRRAYVAGEGGALAFHLFRLPFLWCALEVAWFSALLGLALAVTTGVSHAFHHLVARGSVLDSASRRRLFLALAAVFAMRCAYFLLLRESLTPAVTASADSLPVSLERGLQLAGALSCAVATVACCACALPGPALGVVLKTNKHRVRLAALAVPIALAVLFGPSWLAARVAVSAGPGAPVTEPAVGAALPAATTPAAMPVAAAAAVGAAPHLPLWSPALLAPWAAASATDASGSTHPGDAAQVWQIDRYGSGLNRRLVAVTKSLDGSLAAYDVESADARGRPLPWRLPAISQQKAPQAGGVDLSSVVARIVWALRLGEVQPLFAASGSRLVWRRGLREQVAGLAPFLMPDGPAWRTVAGEQEVTLMNGLCTSRRLGAAPRKVGDAPLQGCDQAYDSVTIVRNGDAGDVRFFAARPDQQLDPLLRTWQSAFPGLIAAADELPPAIRAHRRYPRALFDAQLIAYCQAHGYRTARQPVGLGDPAAHRICEPAYRWSARAHHHFVLQALLLHSDSGKPVGALEAACDDPNFGSLNLVPVSGAPMPVLTVHDASSLAQQVAALHAAEGGTADAGANATGLVAVGGTGAFGFGEAVWSAGPRPVWLLPLYAQRNEGQVFVGVASAGPLGWRVGTNATESWGGIDKGAMGASGSATPEVLASRLLALQDQAEAAVRRGAMAQWAQIMASQRATLKHLQDRLGRSGAH